jgi:hypothetical protein
MLRTGVRFKLHVRTVDSRPGSRSLNGERCDAHQLVACSMSNAYTFCEQYVPFQACENGPGMYQLTDS